VKKGPKEKIMETLVTTDCGQLEQLAGSDNPTTALRARIVLLSLKGYATAEIASTLGVSRKTVWRWRMRFDRGGLDEVTRIPRRSGRKPTVRRSVEAKIIETTLHQPPTQGRRWTTRLLAQTLGVSRAMVHRVWREAGITPPERERQPLHDGNGAAVNGAHVNGMAVCGAH
jgi:transposase